MLHGKKSFWNAFCCLSDVTIKSLIFSLILPGFCFSQNYFRDHFGGSIGIIANIGTHNNSFGLTINSYYHDKFFQFNNGANFHLYHKNIGQRTHFREVRLHTGLVLLAGKKENEIDFLMDGLNHQTTFNYGIGYNYLWYFDNAGTSQLSGGWSIHAKKLSFYLENDIFGGQGKDRFRTAHFQAAYKTGDYRFAAGVNLWTGETKESMWEKVSLDKCPSGYRLLEDLPYGRTSHGILYGGLTYRLPFQQQINIKLGIDSENIRHTIQNRLIHDLIFLPKKIERKTPHYPRLDEDGCPIFDKSQVRKSVLFLQYGLNDYWGN